MSIGNDLDDQPEVSATEIDILKQAQAYSDPADRQQRHELRLDQAKSHSCDLAAATSQDHKHEHTQRGLSRRRATSKQPRLPQCLDRQQPYHEILS